MYWAEAVATAAYTQNRLPTSTLNQETPYQRWYDKQPNVSHMKVFGCVAYLHVPDTERQKLDKKAVRLRFVGYANNAKGYRMFDEEKQKILIRRDVVFNKSDFDWKQEVENSCSENQFVMETDERTPVNADVNETTRKSDRIRKTPKRYGYDEYADLVTVDHYANVCCVTEPSTLKEAMMSSNAKEWQKAVRTLLSFAVQNNLHVQMDAIYCISKWKPGRGNLYGATRRIH